MQQVFQINSNCDPLSVYIDAYYTKAWSRSIPPGIGSIDSIYIALIYKHN